MSTIETRGDCIRCGESPAVDAQGCCGHCHWAFRLEVEAGLLELGRYLESRRLYAEWCEQQGLEP